MSDTVLTPGMRVLCRDAEWLVQRVDPSDYTNSNFAVQCLGVDDLVRGHETIFLTQLDHIEPVDPKTTTLTGETSSGFRLSKLFLEAQLRQMPATGVEPDLENMGAFRTMEFQRATVEWALKQLRPRLLLADAVGLGKTIQVGMILSELMRRGRANRICVLAKKSMLTQFQAELWNRFGIPLVRLDSNGIAKLRLRIPANKNPFEVYHRIIISIDTLKNAGNYRHFLENTRWDCVVIDEAHNVAGASVPERHLAHRLARLLSRRTDSMLLTTATPHNGKRETFGRLISLLDPSAIPDPDLREYTADDIKGFVLMRFKEEVREDAGDQLTDRVVIPPSETSIAATDAEEHVYETLAALREAAEKAKKEGDKSWNYHRLMEYGLYKSFLSSPEACLSTVNKRHAKISEKDPENPELQYLATLQKRLEPLSITKSSRYELLKDQLKQIGWNGKPDSPRVLIFTESRKTQDALAVAIAKDFKLKFSDKYEAQADQVLASIHGSCPDIHLMRVVEQFGTGSAPMRMLIATDVASEGINLHHECHNIIHYDIPWSIITLIQRNGRIDRLGQTESPVLRYLTVSTRHGLLQGDQAIFDRLIEKVEEINSTRQQGESVLKLYDAEAEEQYVAEHGILPADQEFMEKAGNQADNETSELEDLIRDATPQADDDFLKFLLGETDEVPKAPAEEASTSRLRLYSDKQFLIDGYDYLSEANEEYVPIEESEKFLTLTAPPDLRRRLGAPDQRGDVVFGGTAIPIESYPEHNQFRLTDDPSRVELAIKAARNTTGYWSKELLCTDQHPILQWLTERLLMLMPRGEAPLITSKKLAKGEFCFLFIGQVSSRAGAPLIVDAHGFSFLKGGETKLRTLREALDDAGFDSLINDMADMQPHIAMTLIPAAVDASMNHMRDLKKQRETDLIPLLRAEERRLRNWKNRRRDLLEGQLENLPEKHAKAKRYRKELEDMEGYLKDRQDNWRDTHITAAKEPSTRLVLVIEGVD